MFDRSKTITIKILSGGVKEVTVRFPLDEEWCARTRRQKIIRTQVTGGKFKTDILNVEKADGELLEKIRMDKDIPKEERVQFTDAEASKIVNKLDSSEIGEVKREGDSFRIELIAKVGGTTTHFVKIPMEDAARKFSRASTHPLSSRRLEETTVALEPSGEFYDSVFSEATGYSGLDDTGVAIPTKTASVIPITHKDVVVVELLYQVRKIEEELDPEG